MKQPAGKKKWIKIAAAWTMALVMALGFLSATSLRAEDVELPGVPMGTGEDAELPGVPIEPRGDIELPEIPIGGDPDILYSAYVQDQGWLPELTGGQVAGTSGLGLRMEAFQMHFPEGSLYEGSGIEYRTHIQKIGWESEWRRDGEVSGEEGSGLRIEALQIRLTGTLSESYDIYYCVHVQKLGWLSWAKNGDAAGTAGAALRIEALSVCLVAKDGAAPADMGKRSVAYYPRVAVKYAAHVQKIGWQNYVDMGATAGTNGQKLRVEALRMVFAGGSRYADSGIEYRTHVQKIGWESGWKSAGEISGTTGRGLQVEALQIRLTGSAADDYDIYYRAHVQNFGWLGWAKNGEKAGSTGCGYRVEAFQVKIVIKGMPAPGSTENALRKNIYASNCLIDGENCKYYVDRAGYRIKDYTGPASDSEGVWYVKNGVVGFRSNVVYRDPKSGSLTYFLNSRKENDVTFFRAFFNRAVFTGSSVVVGFESYFNWGYTDYADDPLVMARVSYSFLADKYRMSGYMLQYNGVEYQARTAIALAGRKYVFINMGTNDLVAAGPDLCFERYKEYLDGIRADNPDKIIFIEATAPVYSDTNHEGLTNYKIDTLNAYMKDYCAAQKNMYFIDINTPLKNGYSGLCPDYTSDYYVHLTYTGYGVWFRAVMDAFCNELANIEF